ncbi:hypothetical protein EDB85DRAFT_1888652 [Lactarius pseudohatsudake]|nr:hypothetical protein EDB85DRAFT_1888652 [Lactarius pseudohatsudake]
MDSRDNEKHLPLEGFDGSPHPHIRSLFSRDAPIYDLNGGRRSSNLSILRASAEASTRRREKNSIPANEPTNERLEEQQSPDEAGPKARAPSSGTVAAGTQLGPELEFQLRAGKCPKKDAEQVSEDCDHEPRSPTVPMTEQVTAIRTTQDGSWPGSRPQQQRLLGHLKRKFTDDGSRETQPQFFFKHSRATSLQMGWLGTQRPSESKNTTNLVGGQRPKGSGRVSVRDVGHSESPCARSKLSRSRGVKPE